MRLICLLLALGLTGVTRGQESSTESAKIGRILHTMVWTGKEIIVWGGGSEGQFYAHGFRMDSSGIQRTNLAEVGAPSGRWGHAAVWTGQEMIVWGGRGQFESEAHFNDGARYDPKTNVWKPMSSENAPMARSQMASVWTGEELIVWADMAMERSRGIREPGTTQGPTNGGPCQPLRRRTHVSNHNSCGRVASS